MVNDLERQIAEARKIVTRQGDKVRINGISLRQAMLNVNNSYFRRIYGIPKDAELSFVENLREAVCVDGRPISQVLEHKVHDEEFVSGLVANIHGKKRRIIEAQTDGTAPDEIMQLLWDYSSLRLDDLVDLNRVMEFCGKDPKIYGPLSIPTSGITFFETVQVAEMESYGHQILRQSPLTQKSFYFENKGFEHFVKVTSTRKKFLNIMFFNEEVRRQLRERYNLLPELFSFETPSEVYEAIKDIRKKQMVRRGGRASALLKVGPEYRTYIQFAGEALDFNEQNRILRSVSLYNAMTRDPSIVVRFPDLIQERQNREIKDY